MIKVAAPRTPAAPRRCSPPRQRRLSGTQPGMTLAADAPGRGLGVPHTMRPEPSGPDSPREEMTRSRSKKPFSTPTALDLALWSANSHVQRAKRPSSPISARHRSTSCSNCGCRPRPGGGATGARRPRRGCSSCPPECRESVGQPDSSKSLSVRPAARIPGDERILRGKNSWIRPAGASRAATAMRAGSASASSCMALY